MIIRIVRMHFSEAGVPAFLETFNQHKSAIRNFPGCLHLQLLADAHDKTIFTTLSHWNDATSLENYRKSELFERVWARTKIHFTERATAFSLEKYIDVAP